MIENLIGATTAVFPIRLSIAVTSPVDVEWSTRDGSAVAGSDYKAAAGTVTFLPGETEKQIEVQVYGQSITPADDKVFFIRLNPPSNAVLVDAILTCTINIIDDQGTPSVAVVIAEGRRGPKGDPGLSAYEQAVLMGYSGTLAEWMDQLADASKAADRAGDHAVSAAEDALKAQNAAKNAVFAGVVFPTAAEGVDPILGVKNGAYFNVRSPLSEHYIDEYQNVNGVAVATGKSYPTSDYVQYISEHTALPFVPETAYKLNRRVVVTNGDIVKSTIDGNVNDPNVDMTGWVKTNAASQIFDESGRTQQAINNDFINVKTYGAIGDNTLHTVQEWTVIGSRIYYPNLAAIQVDYPHVTSLSDSIDWAAIQKALDTNRDVVGPSAHYHINKSLYIKRTHQKFKDLGFIRMDAGLAKPCLYLGAKDTNGTKSDVQVWFSEISGTAFHGLGNRAEGSAGLSLVSCSQCKIFIDARGFHAGIRVDGVCILNTFFQPILLQNTYGIYDPLGHPSISDIQASAFVGGRIEQNEREGVYSASPNIKFIGTCIEGNGKFNGSDGSTPEVTLLKGSTSGSVTFTDCYMESLDGKSAAGTIVIAPMASRFVKVNSGEYYGGVTNKENVVLVEIASPASNEVGVSIIGASLADYKNYGRGTIVGNSQFVAIGCFTKEPLILWNDVLEGLTGSRPLIEQSDRNYYYSNQDQRIRKITASGPISTTDTITATGLITGNYFSGSSSILGINLYKDKFTRRNRTPTAVTSSYTCIPIIDILPTIVYIFKITAVQKLSNSAGRSFEVNLLVAGNGGSPIILNSQVLWNTDPEIVPSFSVDGTGVVVSNLSSGGVYDFEVTKFGRS